MAQKNYLEFSLQPREEGKKTDKWEVRSIMDRDIVLGEVKWRSGWRRYVFETKGWIVMDAECLRQVADFLAREMEARKT